MSLLKHKCDQGIPPVKEWTVARLLNGLWPVSLCRCFPQLLLQVQALALWSCICDFLWTSPIALPIYSEHTWLPQSFWSILPYASPLLPLLSNMIIYGVSCLPSANLILLPGIIYWVCKKYGLNEWMNECEWDYNETSSLAIHILRFTEATQWQRELTVINLGASLRGLKELPFSSSLYCVFSRRLCRYKWVMGISKVVTNSILGLGCCFRLLFSSASQQLSIIANSTTLSLVTQLPP